MGCCERGNELRVTCSADSFLPSRATASSAMQWSVSQSTVRLNAVRRRPWFDRKSVHVGFVVDRVTVGQVRVQVLGSGSLYQYFIVGRQVKWL